MELQIFSNSEFGEIRTALVNDEPMFCLADVCKALEELIDTQWDVNTDDKAAQETPYEN